jgi:hypothetical protein
MICRDKALPCLYTNLHFNGADSHLAKEIRNLAKEIRNLMEEIRNLMEGD